TVFQHNGFKGAAALAEAGFNLFPFALAEADQFIQKGQCLLLILSPLRGQGKAVRGDVFSQQDTVAVVNQAAVGRNRPQLHAVVLRQVAVFFVQGNLQVSHTPGQAAQQQKDNQAQDNG